MIDITPLTPCLLWDDDCEQGFLALKTAVVQPYVLAYPMRDGPFLLSIDDRDTDMGAVLDQEQDEDGRMAI